MHMHTIPGPTENAWAERMHVHADEIFQYEKVRKICMCMSAW